MRMDKYILFQLRGREGVFHTCHFTGCNVARARGMAFAFAVIAILVAASDANAITNASASNSTAPTRRAAARAPSLIGRMLNAAHHGGAGTRVAADDALVTMHWLTRHMEADAKALLQEDIGWALGVFETMKPHEITRGKKKSHPISADAKLPTMGSQERTVMSIALLANAIRQKIPGDVIETGVYTGGSTISLLHTLALLHSSKAVYACDAFMGLPSPVEQDRTGCKHKLADTTACQVGEQKSWASSRQVFDANVAHYASRMSLSTNLTVLQGWFKDTLPPRQLAGKPNAFSFLRLDGDLYSSTRDALRALYPLLSPGGLVYVDDYGSYAGCAAAIDEYFKESANPPKLQRIWQWSSRPETGAAKPTFEGVWWVKER